MRGPAQPDSVEPDIMTEQSDITWVERVEELSETDLDDLCHATADTIRAGPGFLWTVPPPPHVLEAYWNGVVLVPERSLFVGRLNGRICGSIQLYRPPPSESLRAFAAEITTFFVSSWARRHGLGRKLLRAAEALAAEEGFTCLDLSVRADRPAAIALFASEDYVCWAVKERYVREDGAYVAGRFYSKYLDGTRPRRLEPAPEQETGA